MSDFMAFVTLLVHIGLQISGMFVLLLSALGKIEDPTVALVSIIFALLVTRWSLKDYEETNE